MITIFNDSRSVGVTLPSNYVNLADQQSNNNMVNRRILKYVHNSKLNNFKDRHINKYYRNNCSKIQ